jgi:hypothetical protein
MAIEFRYAKIGEYPRISDFLDQHWAKNHVYTRMRPLFDWSFHRTGHWDPDTYSFSVAVDGDELVGILGAIPFTLNRFGEAAKAVWIVNYVIRVDYRKGATALQLLSSFRKPEFSAVVAFGINPATAVIYQVLRGKVLSEIPRHFLVMPHQESRMVRTLKGAYPAWGSEQAMDLASAFQLARLPIAPSQVSHLLPSGWDERDWPEHASRTIGAARDTDYLNWRYAQHPVFKYEFVAVPDGDRTGLAVWRLETIRAETPRGLEDVDTIARLVEFLPASPTNAEALFAAFLNEVDRAGAMAVDYYGYHGETRKWLREMGFLGSEAHVDGARLPSRFQPLDGKGGGIMSAIFLPSDGVPCSNDSQCSWYWTKSDSDQDRPN